MDIFEKENREVRCKEFFSGRYLNSRISFDRPGSDIFCQHCANFVTDSQAAHRYFPRGQSKRNVGKTKKKMKRQDGYLQRQNREIFEVTLHHIDIIYFIGTDKTWALDFMLLLPMKKYMQGNLKTI